MVLASYYGHLIVTSYSVLNEYVESAFVYFGNHLFIDDIIAYF